MSKRYFMIRFPTEVIEPLDALIKKHPEWGYRTPSEAAKYAVVHFTEYLKRRDEGAPDQAFLIEEIMAMLQRHARRDTASGPGPGKRKPQA